MFIKNNTCALRALEPSDANLLYVWENDKALWSYSNTTLPFSKFVLEEFTQAVSQDIYTTKQLRLMIESLTDKVCVGCADIYDFEPFHLRCGLGIFVNDLHRGKGYAQEALAMMIDYCFNTLLLKQVYAEISEANSASLKLFTNAGFEQTGLKKNWHRVSDSQFENVVVLQLLANQN